MKVFDLVDGRDVELPAEVESGRYRLLSAAILNDTVELAAGALLWSPGVDRCDLKSGGSDVRVRSVFLNAGAEHAARLDLVNRSVQAVMDGMNPDCALSLPSPVMPSKLKEMVDLNELERLLGSDMPHLFNIAQAPRMSMRYDSELMPVGRAQRLAPAVLPRLAAHSEDWYRRDFKGVTPKRLLAEVSEDELRTYENTVYARLLDQLHTHLRRRVRDLKTLESRRTAAHEIGNAEHLDHRLRHRLCALWGAAYSQDDEPGATGEDVLARLTDLLRKVTVLRLGGLYQGIPRDGRIPLALRTTNVLLHDQDYKRMRPLWKLAHAAHGAQVTDGRLQIETLERQHHVFRNYLGLLIRHALRATKLLVPAESPNVYRLGDAMLSMDASETGEFRLNLTSEVLGAGKTLTFVAGWCGSAAWLTGRAERQVVYCHSDHPVDEDVGQWGTGEDAVLNPLQFYAVERVKSRLEGWLLAHLASAYPASVSHWPTASTSALCLAFPQSFFSEARGLRVLKPVSVSDQGKLDLMVRDAKASAQAKVALRAALEIARLMSVCLACGGSADPGAIDADNRAYRAACQCGFGWSWRLGSSGCAERGRYAFEDQSGPFDRVGADELLIDLC